MPGFQTLVALGQILGTTDLYLRNAIEQEKRGEPGPAESRERKVADVIDDARTEIASITGMPIENIRLKLEFVSH